MPTGALGQGVQLVKLKNFFGQYLQGSCFQKPL